MELLTASTTLCSVCLAAVLSRSKLEFHVSCSSVIAIDDIYDLALAGTR